jgi:hypothetical protein
MAEKEFRVRFTADTQQFAGAVTKLAPTQMFQAGQGAGEHLGRGMEHGLHGKFRHLRHVVHLFAGVLGGIMGESFERSFGKTAMTGLAGAMGGMFLVPGSPLLGALAGGAAAIAGHLFMQAGEKTKKLIEISEKFNMSFQDIKEFAKTGIEPDALAKSLEHWKTLLDDIANKKPAVIKALKDIGLEGSDALTRLAQQPAQRQQQIIARRIAADIPGIGTLAGEKASRFAREQADAIKFARAGAAAGGGGAAMMPDAKMLAVTSEEINKLLKEAPTKEGDEFIKNVTELFGGLDEFLKSMNAGILELVPMSEFEKRAAGIKIAGGGPGFGAKDLPSPDSLAKSGIFLTGGVGGENYQQTTIGLLSQIGTKVDAVREAVKSHEQTTKAQ